MRMMLCSQKINISFFLFLLQVSVLFVECAPTEKVDSPKESKDKGRSKSISPGIKTPEDRLLLEILGSRSTSSRSPGSPPLSEVEELNNIGDLLTEKLKKLQINQGNPLKKESHDSAVGTGSAKKPGTPTDSPISGDFFDILEDDDLILQRKYLEEMWETGMHEIQTQGIRAKGVVAKKKQTKTPSDKTAETHKLPEIVVSKPSSKQDKPKHS